IAYIGVRNASREVIVINLDGQPEGEALNLSKTPDSEESSPAWSPDGTRIAYTSRVEGIEGIYVKSLISPDDPPRLIGRGSMAAWNPVDGSSVFYAVPQGRSSALYLGQVENFGIGANAVAFDGQISHVDWTASQHSLSGFDPRTPLLYAEQVTEQGNGKITFVLLNNINAPDPVLSDAVNDSFDAMRSRVIERIGVDLLGSVESVFWRRERLPEPGQDRRSWHYTGRAFDLSRDLVLEGTPPPLVVVREDTELGTAWRVYARVPENRQDGELGEPLRDLPWDFASRADDPQAFEAGGRKMEFVPPGYYVDLTKLFADFGWERTLADRTWRSNFSAVLFWQFEKREDLSWEDAMLEIYSQQEVQDFIEGNIAQPPTALPPPTGEATEAATAIPGGDRPRTATPIPPDLLE
ncbi:MAG TPA: hypothetical protein VJZ27_06825, partial [Aggregatilineales bacterium]|nr:hypothetical protein [Aggregatilineales bacterium]